MCDGPGDDIFCKPDSPAIDKSNGSIYMPYDLIIFKSRGYCCPILTSHRFLNGIL